MHSDRQLKYLLETRLNIKIRAISSVSGGSINETFKITTDHEPLFLKYNDRANSVMFQKEAVGLKILNKCFRSGHVPKVIDCFHGEGNKQFLIIEWIQEGPKPVHFFEKFGVALAEMHHIKGEYFGLNHDNFIGRLTQSNRKHKQWSTFFVDERIRPQVLKLINSGKASPTLINLVDKLRLKMDNLFPVEKPTLLHGDLWSGNFLCNSDGKPVLIDPAIYYGHREMEIAFTRLFGGFTQHFYDAYNNSYPLESDYEDRTSLCQLYPLLVHANLFGGNYLSQSLSVFKHYV